MKIQSIAHGSFDRTLLPPKCMDVLLADEATYDKASSLEVALGLIGLSRFDDAVGRLRKAAFRGLRMLVKELKLPLQRLR